MATKANPVFLVIVLLTFLFGFIHAAPVAGPQPHDPRSVLDGFNKIGAGVAELDKAIKAYTPQTEVGTIRTLTYNVEWSIMSTFNHVRQAKDFNEKDSKAVTAANLKTKQALETMLRDLTAKKDVIKKANKVEFLRNNFESLHDRFFPLADALENKATDPDSKEIGRAIDELDKAFEKALNELK